MSAKRNNPFALNKTNSFVITEEPFLCYTKEKRRGLIDKIRDLPTHAEYVNKNGDLIYLCHAGRQPDTKEIQDMRRGDIPMNNYIWDRRHIFDKTWRGKNNEYCVHGHTPVETMYYYVDLKIVNKKDIKFLNFKKGKRREKACFDFDFFGFSFCKNQHKRCR